LLRLTTELDAGTPSLLLRILYRSANRDSCTKSESRNAPIRRGPL